MENLRKYRNAPYSAVLIHGGPGAPGSLTPVAEELSHSCGVIEPFQTSGSIEGLIEELKNILEVNGTPPLNLIGHSWGAWLSLIFTAKYPDLVKKLIFIGSGPFEEKYAQSITDTRLNRLKEEDKLKVFALHVALLDPAEADKNTLFAQFGKLLSAADAYDPISEPGEAMEYQFEIYQSLWKEASELRKTGELLEYIKEIRCPVVAVHGDYDPHPSEGVNEPLSNNIDNYRFYLLEKCGHEPWNERHAKDRFYKILKDEIEIE